MRVWATWLVVLIGSASAVSAASYTWTGGGGANTNWSSPENWGGNAPSNDETAVGLVFPALAGHYDSNNDLTNLQVTSLGVTTQLSDGKYTFTGNTITLSGPVTMASPGTGNPNLVWQVPITLGDDVTITASGRQTQLQGSVDLGAHTLTLATVGDIVLAGVVSGSGNLIKNDSSALTITGTNTYTGSTTSNAGALYIDSAEALGDSGTGTTFNGGFLGFAGESFTTLEPVMFNGGDILAYGTPSMAGQVTLHTTINVETFEDATILTIGGTIVGAGDLIKSGPGLLVLNAPSELYTGSTAVGEGTLQLDATLTSTRFVTVQNTATLRGDGSTEGSFTIQNGGAIAPGSSPGVLSSTGLTMVAGATFAAEIDGPKAPQYDTLVVAGPVSLGGAILTVSLGYPPLDGEQFTLISHLQGEPIIGTFLGLDEGAVFEIDGTTFSITYAGGTGSDVVLIAGTPPTPTITPTGAPPTDTATPTATVPSTATSTAAPTLTATIAAPTSTATIPLPSTQTPTPSATLTTALTPTRTFATPATPTSSPTTLATPTRTAAVPFCTGDCNGDGVVLVNELVLGVNIALETLPFTACSAFDSDEDGRVTIPELIQAVNHALSSCP
jgi:autotransporter-associated beta strand protein